jgi:hypothetical protein
MSKLYSKFDEFEKFFTHGIEPLKFTGATFQQTNGKGRGSRLPVNGGILTEPESIGNLRKGDEAVNMEHRTGSTLKHG